MGKLKKSTIIILCLTFIVSIVTLSCLFKSGKTYAADDANEDTNQSAVFSGQDLGDNDLYSVTNTYDYTGKTSSGSLHKTTTVGRKIARR